MKKLLLLLPLILLTACESIPKRDPAFAPVRPSALQPPKPNNGSLYQAGYDVRLFEDDTARRVGDILTVMLAENTDAKKEADNEVKKKNQTSVSLPTILGESNREILGFELETSLKSDNNFKGEGETNQSNSLTGNIAVTVVELLPNGNLIIRGEKRVTLNDGDEFIRLSGIVRPVDIGSDNVISSNKVADATIMYTGEGALADGSKLGWMSRFFNSPYFPF
ncbi:MAG: flagellar basal body L-ring protein FlgH [Gammaproteobacteria bacterium]|nr:MAG: flagellar basal body L-ring protein FlgH [Gammaproteobacteria bacterium]RLA21763.1 MAG: flagellar basal body L-ring protein FlgH [Gammaproteobacteria bacterium]